MVKNTSVFQFTVGYMTHQMQEKRRKHIYRTSYQDVFIHISIQKMRATKDQFKIKYVLVLSLIIFDHNRTIVVYKVIGTVIYLFIDILCCLYYLGILQQKLSTYDNKFEKKGSMICLGLVFLKI